MRRAPVVGIACDRRTLGHHSFHVVGEKYIAAIREGARAVPLLIPSLSDPLDVDAVLKTVDGLLFPGSPSNVAPHHYGGHDPRDPSLLDEARDSTSLPLLHAAVAGGVPMLCICRGFQELNVALGGTLHQHLDEIEGYADHREREEDPVEVQYGPAHTVRVVPGGLLAGLVPPGIELVVNSLHEQGVDRLAPALKVEALAPDGAVEAVSLCEGGGFVLGLQWHPEWRFAENPLSRAIFEAFGDALRRHLADAAYSSTERPARAST